MIRETLTLSALIAAVLLVRAVFKNRVPKRMIYALWLVVLLKLCLPGTLFSLPVLPAEQTAAPVQRAEFPAQTAPVTQPPAQAVQPQTPAQPVTQEPANPAAKPLTATQIFRIIWFSGSALLGLWMLGSWLVFTIRLRKSRKFLGRHGKTSIYVSSRIPSPCLAGLIPAVYLTRNVLQNDTAALILRHELTHLRHLDPLWSFCRTAAVVVYWWNPLVWLAAIVSKRDAELACDEAVAAGLLDSERIAYARAILAQAPRRGAALSLAGQGAHRLPHQKAAHERPVRRSGPDPRPVRDRLLLCRADAAEIWGDHSARSGRGDRPVRGCGRGSHRPAGRTGAGPAAAASQRRDL